MPFTQDRRLKVRSRIPFTQDRGPWWKEENEGTLMERRKWGPLCALHLRGSDFSSQQKSPRSPGMNLNLSPWEFFPSTFHWPLGMSDLAHFVPGTNITPLQFVYFFHLILTTELTRLVLSLAAFSACRTSSKFLARGHLVYGDRTGGEPPCST